MDLNYIDPESRALNKYFLFAIIQHNKYTLEKATYMDIQIAHDDLQRLDLFKLAQFLRIPHNQLPLLRLRSQTTSYIPTHLHLSNTHTYTPYAERYCLSCLPLQIPGDETYTLLHCPHFSPPIQPAIRSIMLNLRQFDLWAWATYTDTQKVAMYSDLSHQNLIDNMRRYGFS